MRKFIPGTNKQYSLDENAILISHYRRWGNRTKLRTDRVVKHTKVHNSAAISICINGKHTIKTLKGVMTRLFFNDDNPRNYIFIDGNPLNCACSNLKYCKHRKRSQKEMQRDWRINNPEKCRESARRARKRINKSHVADSIKLQGKKVVKVEDISDDFYRYYKELLKVKRLLMEKHGVNMEFLNK